MKSVIFFELACLMAAISFVQCEECDSNEVCSECPFVPTVANLDKKRFAFAGTWYSIQESSQPKIPCIHFDVKASSDGFRLNFLPYNIKSNAIQKNSDDTSKGFKIEIELEKLNGGNFTVFDTDYENYAGVFTCKKTNSEFFHSVTFWSRTRELNDNDVRIMKSVLTRYDVDYTDLENIFQSQNGCGATDPIVTIAAKTLLPLLEL